MFTNCPGDWCSIPDQDIPRTQKMVLDTSLLNTQHNKVHIKGKMEQSKERSNRLLYTLLNSYGQLSIIISISTYIYIYIYRHRE